jgi:hypothetical protein
MGSVLSQLGVRGGRGSKAAMLNAFGQFARELPLNERIAIMIDEAQALNDDALEEFRLLSNLERHGRKAAQIVLAGQFELTRRLADPALHHLKERIGARSVLLPLTALECRQYIEHRLHLCGASSDKLFARRTLDYIVHESAGIPRRVNALCHNSLLLAYSAGARAVTLAMAREAAADYGHLSEKTRQDRGVALIPARFARGLHSLSPVVGVGLLGIAGFVSGQLVMSHDLLHHLGFRAAPASSSVAAASVPMASVDPKIVVSSPAMHVAAEPIPPEVESAALNSPPPGTPDLGSESSVVKSEVSAPPATSSSPTTRDSTSAASAPPAAVRPGGARRFVIVAPGESLALIAIRHLGSKAGVRRMMQLNPDISDASRVYPGEKVYLPSSAASFSIQDADDTDVE